MEMGVVILVGLVCLGVGAAAGFLGYRYSSESKLKSATVRAQEIIAGAEATRKEIEVRAKEDTLKLRDELEQELARKRQELVQQEERLQKRQANLDRRYESLETRERNLNKRQSALDRRTNELDKMHQAHVAELERIAEMTREDAKAELLEAVRQDSRQDMARVIREVEAETKLEADRKAREIKHKVT